MLDAAESLFAQQGIEATTVADIAERAGSSVGSFYHHFRDKRAVQYALFDRFVAEAEQTTLDAIAPDRWEGASIADILRSYVELKVVQDREQPAVKRAGLAVAQTESELGARFAKVSATLDQGLRDLLVARRSEIGHPDPELAVTYVLHLLAAVLQARLTHDPSEGRHGPAADDDFVAETTRAVCRYLDVAPPST
ncbi:MAG: TetR/AcrR family transcriptional regulator [Actinomycetota bacterium]